ncbi:MAG: Oligopeptide-binding protein AppA [Myxococcota bacterium]|nr:Oligopeptide-binding protein AppA [Myxococcota bacterium]
MRPPSRFAALAAILWALNFAAGCQPQNPPGALTVLVEFPVDTVDPRHAVSAWAGKTSGLVFSGLTRIASDGSPIPDLCENIQTPVDLEDSSGLRYRCQLRANARFHDGSPVTADDVRFTIEALRDPRSRAAQPAFQRIAEVLTPSPVTVEFILREPYAPFLADLARGVLPASRANRDDFQQAPTGAGPYRVIQFHPEQVVLEPFPGHHAGAPRGGRVEIRTVRDDTTRVLELMRGRGHLIQNGVPFALLPRLRAEDDLRVETAASSNTTYLAFNFRDPILSKREVRQAIAHAINVEELIRYKFLGAASPAASLIAPGHWAHDPSLHPVPHDPARARRLLDQAGFPDPDGDGPAMRFHLIYKTSSNKFRGALALAIADQLRRAGIGVEVRSYEFAAFFDDVQKGNFQICSLMWTRILDPDILYQVFHSSQIPGPAGNGYNRGAYSNPEADRLLEDGRREARIERRKDIYAKAQQLLARDLPYLFLAHEHNVAVSRTALRGYALRPDAWLDGLTNAWLEN